MPTTITRAPAQAASFALPPLFDSLDEDVRASVAARCERLVLRPGDPLLIQGEAVQHLYVVEDGVLESEFVGARDTPVAVGTIGVGEYCGEMSFLRGEPAAVTVRAASGAIVLAVPHAVLTELSERFPAVMKELGSAVAKKLSQANQRIRRAGTGRIVAVAGVDAEWAAAALTAVARSCARQLRDRVVLIDLTSSLSNEPGVRGLAPLSDILRNHSLLHGEGERAVDVCLTRGSPAMLRDPATAALFAALRHQCGLAIIAVDAAEPGEALAPASAELDGETVHLRPEHGPRASSSNGTAPRPTVLLRRGSSPALPAALKTLSSHYGCDVLRVVPGDLAQLRALTEAGGSEPGVSIDWVARHLLARKVGLALGAGGSKGYAHLGVFDQLTRMGIPIDYVAGCSIGAPVAASIARGTPIADTKRALDEVFQKALRPTLPISSFLSSRRLRGRLDRIIAGQTFEELRLPLAIIAADMERKTEVVFREGSLLTAVMASMAIPGIFPSVEVDGRPLVDGAILNPIPNLTLSAMGANVVIGVRLAGMSGGRATHARRLFRSPPIVDTIAGAFEVMQWKLAVDTAARADITIEPRFEGRTGLHEYTRGEEFIETGREAAEAARTAIRTFLPWVL